MPGAALPWTSIFMVFGDPVSGFALPVRVQLRKCRYKGQCAKRAVGGGVRVAADNGIPGKVTPCSGPITWTIP